MRISTPRARELFLGITAETFPQLRQDYFAGMHQHHPEHVLFRGEVEIHPFAQEIVHGPDGFNAGKTAARHHHRQRRLPPVSSV